MAIILERRAVPDRRAAPAKYELIGGVISFFHQDFSSYYASTIAIVEKLPDQINNEIRNAMSHLARANASDNIATIQLECDRARAHIERANRDCLKCSIITLRKKIHRQVFHAKIHLMGMPPGIIQQKKYIERERNRLILAEEYGEAGITPAYEKLLLSCSHLDDSLNDLFGELPVTVWGRIHHFLSAHVIGFSSGVLASLIASCIYAKFR